MNAASTCVHATSVMMRLRVDARFVTLTTVAIVTVVTDANSALVRAVATALWTAWLL